MDRCVPYVMNEGKDREAAVGMCEAIYDEHSKKCAEMIHKKYGNVVEHAGSGFRMPEESARIIDELAKDLPKDFTYRRMAKTPVEFHAEEGERTDVSFITTDAVDRDGDVVLPQGGDWKNYNRVVPMGHDYSALPVGVNWWIRPKMGNGYNGLVAKTHYPVKPKDWGDAAPWLPSAVLHLMQLPIPTCTGKSIGFLPMKITEASTEEKSRRPDWDGRPIIREWVGIEYSVAPVPANDTAEMIAVSKALKSGALTDEYAEILDRYFHLKVKDMTGGDMGGMVGAAMQCPAGHTGDAIRKTDQGMYHCAMCNKVYPAEQMKPADNDHDEDDVNTKKRLERERLIAEALAAPHYTQAAHQKARQAQLEAFRREMEEAAAKKLSDTIALLTGRI